MDVKKYKLLKKELPVISKIVSSFPESVQGKAYDTLVNTMLGIDMVPLGTDMPLDGTSSPKNISLIAEKVGEKFQFNDIDLKADSRADAVRKLILVAIRTHEIIMEVAKVSRKDLLNKLMKRWGFTFGTDRSTFADIRGVHKDGDFYSLDTGAKGRADKYIKNILDPSIKGKWKLPIGKKKRVKKKVIKKNTPRN